MSSVITISDLQNYLPGEVINGVLSQLIVDATNEYIKSSTNRVFGEVVTETEELHDYAPVMFLRYQDVTAITEVKRGRYEHMLIPSILYFWNPLGRLEISRYRSKFTPYRDYVRVTYTHGVATVPADLKLAALSTAADFYRFNQDGQKEVTSESVGGNGGMRLIYTPGADARTSKVFTAIVNRYRTAQI